MINFIKDLYDYELVKKCLKCGNISLKVIFIKIEIEKMAYNLIVNRVKKI